MKQIQVRPIKFVWGRIVQNVLPVLILFVTYTSLHAQSLIPELVFMNPQLKTGAGCSGPDQDPVNGTGYDNAWQPRVSYGNGNAPEHSNWWMEFKISFVKHDHPGQSVSVNQFFVFGLDIVGDGQKLHEFQSYYKMQYFTLEQNTDMTASSVKGCLTDPQLDGKRFDGPVKNDKGITTTASDVMVSSFYHNTSSLIVRVGAETGAVGSNSADRMYALWFKSLTYDVPVSTPLPLTLVAFHAQLGNNQDVKLNRTSTMEQNEFLNF